MASIAPLLYRLAPQYGLDPDALQAVARGEGGLVNRADDIGDLSGGGSYGPFQLYTKGALPAQYRGKPQAADKWAWSEPGIRYALGRMVAAGAKGLRGRSAVDTIIRKFERPLHPDKSIANALARLGAGSGPLINAQSATPAQSAASAPVPLQGMPPQNTTNPRRAALLAGLTRGEDIYGLINRLPSIASTSPAQALRTPVNALQTPARAMPAPAPAAVSGGKGVNELIYDPVGSIFDGVSSAKPYGGHPNHVHYAAKNAQQMLQALSIAKQMGLSRRENPYTDPVDPVHTKGSNHYKLFPGLYNGRKLGQAADISGDPVKLKALYARLAGL